MKVPLGQMPLIDIPHALVTIYIVTFFWWQRCLRNTPVLIILTILYFVFHDCVEFWICFVDNLHDGFGKDSCVW